MSYENKGGMKTMKNPLSRGIFTAARERTSMKIFHKFKNFPESLGLSAAEGRRKNVRR